MKQGYDDTLSKFMDNVTYELIEENINITFNLFDRCRENGVTVLKNNSNIISNQNLKQILNLLHKDYQDLGMKITIYKNKFQVFNKWLNILDHSFNFKIVKGVINGNLAGNHGGGIISLFPFNHKFNSNRFLDYKFQLYMLFDLLHEIRHAYQRIHKKKKYEVEYIDAGNKGYSSQWCERDANAFAQRFMNKHKEQINDILKINGIDWECLWGRFTIYY